MLLYVFTSVFQEENEVLPLHFTVMRIEDTANRTAHLRGKARRNMAKMTHHLCSTFVEDVFINPTPQAARLMPTFPLAPLTRLAVKLMSSATPLRATGVNIELMLSEFD